MHDRPRACPRSETAAVNDDFAAWDCSAGRDSIDAGKSVFFRRGAESEFHTRLKCNARRNRIAAYTPAIQSSAITPQPCGSRSRLRDGNGFQISNTRKRIKPISRYFQFTRLSAKKIA